MANLTKYYENILLSLQYCYFGLSLVIVLKEVLKPFNMNKITR